MDLGAVPYQLEEEKSVSEDAGPKGDGLRCPTLVGEENKPPFIKVFRKECQRGC